jgi:hypothetical protein
MNIAPRRHQHLPSGANQPSDVGVTVNINAEFNLVAGNPIIEFVSRDLITESCKGLVSSAVYTVPPFLSSPSLVAQIEVYLARRCICRHR